MEENIIQDTPEAALVAAQAYLLLRIQNPEIHVKACTLLL
jgi:hypothetical protein